MKNFLFKVNEIIKNTVGDLKASQKLWRYWSYRSFVTYRLRFQTSRLGFYWPIVSLLIVVAILGTVWGIILGRRDNPYEYYLYLLLGFWVWQFISGAVKEGNKGLVDSFRADGLPFTVFLYERWFINAIAFINSVPLVLLGILIFGTSNLSFINLLYLPVALIFLSLWAFGTIAILAMIVSFKPDLKHLINAVMRLAFLATPVIWEPSRLGDHQQLLWLNPFFSPLEMMRFAMSGTVSNPEVLWVGPVYSVLVFFIGLAFFARYLNRLKFKVVA